tara:strand:+ start:134 stop:1048 length:915 start_codon:yes stop_codon:yes gene_type:complete
MKITIVGFGETGASISALLINQNACDLLNIMDPGENIHGRLLDMSHAATAKSIEVTHNQNEQFKASEVIFYCAGIRNLKNTNRQTNMEVNKFMVSTIFSDIEFISKPIIIVITNPVELISTWINEYFNDQFTVIGTGTYLDSVRFQYILANHFCCKLDEVSTMVLGEHGDSMTPILSKTTIKGINIVELKNAFEQEVLIKKLKTSANEIRKTEEATKHGVAQCAVVLMNGFTSSKTLNLVASVKVPESIKSKIELKSSVFMSLPCTISKNQLEVSTTIQVDECELALLKNSAAVLDEAYFKLQD